MLFNGIHWALRWSWRYLSMGFVVLNPRYGVQVDTVQLIADGLKLRALIYFRQQKTRYIAVTGFS